MRKHGLTADNMVGAEMITADGEQVRASENENPDLFWALRGGGGNLGSSPASTTSCTRWGRSSVG